jgi:Asp-tRNA(Asn)/Glu-tRNA(Gln) amidotransferase A subunit family amidase
MHSRLAAEQDRQFARTGRLVGPLHGVVLAIKDQYDTFDMRTTSGADVDYANDRPPDDATFVKRLRDAGAIILAKANLAEYAVDGARSAFGGTFCNPYDTEREPGMSSAGSATAVAANLVTCAIAEETVVSVRWPASVNSTVGLAPTQELVSRDGMMGAGLNMRVGPICRTGAGHGEGARCLRRLRPEGRVDRVQCQAESRRNRTRAPRTRLDSKDYASASFVSTCAPRCSPKPTRQASPSSIARSRSCARWVR